MPIERGNSLLRQPKEAHRAAKDRLRPAAPSVPQTRLPNGIKDPMEAVQAINQDINRLAKFTGGQYGEVAREKIRNLEWQRDQILKQSTPMDVRPGTTLLDPRSGQPVFQAPPASAGNVALQRFLSENPDASAEQIQQFVQSGRGGARSGVGMYMQRFLQENPNATAEDMRPPRRISNRRDRRSRSSRAVRRARRSRHSMSLSTTSEL
jgi:hypothetical protein